MTKVRIFDFAIGGWVRGIAGCVSVRVVVALDVEAVGIGVGVTVMFGVDRNLEIPRCPRVVRASYCFPALNARLDCLLFACRSIGKYT